ncbi:hypothetical protein [Nocardia gamkensis]|uniref:hypothetical protein n=1 Tax=Nocardia gamkensis TaxID=352869 RepID=UPI0037CA88C1
MVISGATFPGCEVQRITSGQAIPLTELDRTYKLEAKCDFTATNGHTTAPGNVQYTAEFTLHSS